jgi:hypothetical protein
MTTPGYGQPDPNKAPVGRDQPPPSSLIWKILRVLSLKASVEGKASVVYYDHPQAGDLTWDEARRIAANIAKLPDFCSDAWEI